MKNELVILAQLFPWDRQNESALGHHHLVAAYCFAWGVHLTYLLYIGLRWRAQSKADPKPGTSKRIV